MSSEHFDSRLSLFDDGISRDFSLNNHKEDDDNYSHHGEQAVEKLSQRETRNVKGCRFLVLLLILVACVIISTTSYYYLRGEEKDDYVASVRYVVCDNIAGAWSKPCETETRMWLFLL